MAIRKLSPSDRDQLSLSRALQFAVAREQQPETYWDRVVVKPWGYEFLVFQNEHVAVWKLHILYQHATSLHCHRRKKTSLLVLRGSALCNTLGHRHYVNAMDALVIDPGVFHSTKALSKDGVDVIEIESPPDKTDLVRLNDQYGREGLGYEGLTEMVPSSSGEFPHFRLQTSADHLDPTYGYGLGLRQMDDRAQVERAPLEVEALYCVLAGAIVAPDDGATVAGTGEALTGGEFLDRGCITAGTCLLLELRSRAKPA